jgi:hypothetical protein
MNLKMFSVDDGATHTIVAQDEAQALGIYLQENLKMGGDWPTEKPDVEEMDPRRDFTLRLDDGEKRVKMAVSSWCHMFSNPQYLGCSEW